MFKNLMMYRMGPAWAMDVAELESRLQAMPFEECGATQEKSVGWVPPRGELHGPLVEVVDGQWLLKLMLESKSVPSSVINRKTKERAAQIEAATGRKPGKKETRDLKDETRIDLLPMAFTKQGSTLVWIDPQARLLVLDAGSTGRADEVLTCLAKAMDGLGAMMLQTTLSPAAAMAEWLTSQEPPAGFSIDRECELKAPDESKSVVRYARHALDIEEVQQHVAHGKVPTRLALTWEGRVSFMLTDTLQIKKLAFLDGVFADDPTVSKDDRFEADAAIATGEIRKMIPDLLMALGQEMVVGAAPAEGEATPAQEPAAPRTPNAKAAATAPADGTSTSRLSSRSKSPTPDTPF